MLQLIVLLAASWLLIWLFEKGNLSVLGLRPTKTRLKYIFILFFISAIICSLGFLLRMYLVKEEYVITPSLTVKLILLEIWYQFRTVFTEELICRGALLYILIKKIGQSKAIIISSVIFAALHWFNSGVWGNAVQMAIIFAFTFVMGLLLAYSYARTFSILIPFSIHYGWNLTQNYIFPGSTAGNHLLSLAAPPPEVTISYAAFFTMLLAPKILVLIADYLIVRKHPQVTMPQLVE